MYISSRYISLVSERVKVSSAAIFSSKLSTNSFYRLSSLLIRCLSSFMCNCSMILLNPVFRSTSLFIVSSIQFPILSSSSPYHLPTVSFIHYLIAFISTVRSSSCLLLHPPFFCHITSPVAFIVSSTSFLALRLLSFISSICLSEVHCNPFSCPTPRSAFVTSGSLPVHSGFAYSSLLHSRCLCSALLLCKFFRHLKA